MALANISCASWIPGTDLSFPTYVLFRSLYRVHQKQEKRGKPGVGPWITRAPAGPRAPRSAESDRQRQQEDGLSIRDAPQWPMIPLSYDTEISFLIPYKAEKFLRTVVQFLSQITQRLTPRLAHSANVGWMNGNSHRALTMWLWEALKSCYGSLGGLVVSLTFSFRSVLGILDMNIIY